MQIHSWQKPQWENLARRVERGELPHALLLSGATGIGKSDFARAFAEFILCASADKFAELRACGKCSACKLLAVGNHPDLMLVLPESLDDTASKKSKSAKPSSAIKIDQIRELTRALSQTSQQGGWQVALIDPADTLNVAAANALLKTLEEPEASVLLILVSKRPQLLPATIRSRCQRLDFAAPQFAVARDWLRQTEIGAAARSDAIEQALALADNAPLAALSWLEGDQLKLRARFLGDLLAAHTAKIDAVTFAENYGGADFEFLIATWSSLVSDLAKICIGVDSQFLSNADVFELQRNFVKCSDALKLLAFHARLLEVQKLLENRANFNRQLMLEDLWVRWGS